MKDEKIRSLEEVCNIEDLSIKLLGSIFCGVSMSNAIECQYQKYHELDNLYKCENPFHAYQGEIQ